MPQQEDTQFWQEWGRTKEQIDQMHKALFNGGRDGLIHRINRLEKLGSRLVVFCFCVGFAGAASAHTWLQGTGSWVPGSISLAASLAAIIMGGWSSKGQ